MSIRECPFCENTSEIIAENAVGYAILDGFPVSKGHCLVIPRKHVPGFFDLSYKYQSELWRLVSEVREILSERYEPDGFNVGLNDGDVAGQTVMHSHVHVIPRYKDDLADPRGGVRWVLPESANYWD